MTMSPGSRPSLNGSRSASVSNTPSATSARPSRINTRPDGMILRENAAPMQPEQDLHQPVRDQLVQREEFLVGADDGVGVVRIRRLTAAGAQRRSCFLDDGVREHLSRHFPQRNKAVDRGGEADFEDAE